MKNELIYLFIPYDRKLNRIYMNHKMNNPIWLMSAAFDKRELPDLIDKTKDIGASGIDL